MKLLKSIAPIILSLLVGCVDSSPADSFAASERTQPGIGGAARADLECTVETPATRLPGEVRETSGIARGRARSDVFWTHNDRGNGPTIYAIDAGGSLLGRTEIEGVDAADWEDIAAAPCAGGDCLLVADIGDNDGDRAEIAIIEIPEPEPASARATPASVLRGTYPAGARDAEAMFALPDGSVFVVTKGREHPIELYRFPRDAAGARLVLVRELFPHPADDRDWVTSASATPDGRWVAIRTYREIFLYPAADLVNGQRVVPRRFDLSDLGEPQGEGIEVADDGRIWLTSEAERAGDLPRFAALRCSLE